MGDAFACGNIDAYPAMKPGSYQLIGINNNILDSIYNIGSLYLLKKNYNKMKTYYLMAIEQNHLVAISNLATYYKLIEYDYINMEKYYKLAAELNCIFSMNNLANYYYMIKAYDKLEYYCKKAINLVNCPNSWLMYGQYFLTVKNDTKTGINMILISKKLGCNISDIQLALIYCKIGNYKEMHKYYELSIQNQKYISYFYLSLYYDKIQNDHINALKYAELAVENNIYIGYLCIAKYYLFDDYNIILCRHNLNKFFEIQNNINDIIINKLEKSLGKDILLQLFIMYDGNNININNKINEYKINSISSIT
jgi:hypothetical protein